jgi:hypothetical protein
MPLSDDARASAAALTPAGDGATTTRCDVHGLALQPDGGCVLCRRTERRRSSRHGWRAIGALLALLATATAGAQIVRWRRARIVPPAPPAAAAAAQPEALRAPETDPRPAAARSPVAPTPEAPVPEAPGPEAPPMELGSAPPAPHPAAPGPPLAPVRVAVAAARVAAAAAPAGAQTVAHPVAPERPAAAGGPALPPGTVAAGGPTLPPGTVAAGSAPRERPKLGPFCVDLFYEKWCPVCQRAIGWLQRSHWPGACYRLLDLQARPDARARYRQLVQGNSIPVFEVDGAVIVGFRPRAVEAAIRAALERRGVVLVTP